MKIVKLNYESLNELCHEHLSQSAGLTTPLAALINLGFLPFIYMTLCIASGCMFIKDWIGQHGY